MPELEVLRQGLQWPSLGEKDLASCRWKRMAQYTPKDDTPSWFPRREQALEPLPLFVGQVSSAHRHRVYTNSNEFADIP
jgi:hypothetical protein